MMAVNRETWCVQKHAKPIVSNKLLFIITSVGYITTVSSLPLRHRLLGLRVLIVRAACMLRNACRTKVTYALFVGWDKLPTSPVHGWGSNGMIQIGANITASTKV